MEENLYAELKQLGVKIDHLTELFNHAAHGDGFPRCAGHGSRLRRVEADVELCHRRIGGVNKWLVAGLISIVSMLANVVWNLVQNTLHR
jgi:hypothetical protein